LNTYTLVHRGDYVPVFFVPARPAHFNFGTQAAPEKSTVSLSVMALCLLMVTYLSLTLTSRPWYWRRRFNQTGKGPLPY